MQDQVDLLLWTLVGVLDLLVGNTRQSKAAYTSQRTKWDSRRSWHLSPQSPSSTHP